MHSEIKQATQQYGSGKITYEQLWAIINKRAPKTDCWKQNNQLVSKTNKLIRVESVLV